MLGLIDRMDPAVQPKTGNKQYLRCTPRSHLFEQNSEGHRSNVLLHALSKWAKGEAAPTNLAKGRGICVNSHFDSGNIEVRFYPCSYMRPESAGSASLNTPWHVQVLDISQAQARGVSHELNLRIHACVFAQRILNLSRAHYKISSTVSGLHSEWLSAHVTAGTHTVRATRRLISCRSSCVTNHRNSKHCSPFVFL